MPLRQRLKERGQALAEAQQILESGLASGDGKRLGDALAVADPLGSARCPLDWGRHAETLALWVGRLWESDDPYPLLAQLWAADPLPGAGLWLPAAVLHLRDPQRFSPYADEQRQGHARLDDGVASVGSPAERYRLFNEAVVWLREKHALHPLEAADVLAEIGAADSSEHGGRMPRSALSRSDFHGFCPDTFDFLGELAREPADVDGRPARPLPLRRPRPADRTVPDAGQPIYCPGPWGDVRLAARHRAAQRAGADEHLQERLRQGTAL